MGAAGGGRPEFDLKKAKRLLTEAGYANGFETELIVGTPVTT